MSTPLRELPDAPLGTLIFRAGLLPAETIESALEEGVKTGKRLGEILTERGLISEVDLARLLAGQKGLEFVTLREQIVDPSAAGLFTEEQARLFRALPYAFDGELPVVAIADPTDDVLIRNIREALGREDARFVVTARSELADIAADVYSRPLQPRPEAEPDPEQAFEPAPAAEAVPETAHTNGHAPADTELVLEPVAPEPDPVAPEPDPVAPAPPGFQAPLEETPEPEDLTAPEPVQAPEPEPVAVSEPGPPVHPEPQHLPEPAHPVQPEPPFAQEPAMPAEPVAVPEATLGPAAFSPSPPPAEPAAAPEAPTVGLPFEPPPDRDPEPVAAEPVPFPQPAPAPPPDPYPPAAVEPEPEPEHEAEPAPVADPPESPAPVAPTVPWRMTIRLSNGERVDAGEFSDEASAKQEAKAIMMQVAAADADDWPYVNGRFLKPDTIVSVDIAEDDGSET
jgi:hypothetical protein